MEVIKISTKGKKRDLENLSLSTKWNHDCRPRHKRLYHFSRKEGGQPKHDIGLSGAKKDDIFF